ncbi:MAG TPA: intersectin-EH binding protein Ibp1 [Mycobacterium sp.]|nr:intersectin-EH binding protein Ibp1 [Mycobacterium sp.]HQC75812.1 intersectin-EH binding protein Ibp1 [Mycobacterium sp.]
MATHATFAQRLLIAGGFAVAISVAPLVSAFGGSHAATPLAECPVGQELNPLTATCHPSGNAENPIVSPINPEGANLQPGSLTGAEAGEVGRLPEVNGIPCNGQNTGLCIGLSENNEALNASPSDPFGNSN